MHICLVRQRARFLYTFYDRLGSGEQNVHTNSFLQLWQSIHVVISCDGDETYPLYNTIYIFTRINADILVYNTCILTWIFFFVLELFIIYSTRVSVKYSIHSLAFVYVNQHNIVQRSLWFVAAATKDTNNNKKKMKKMKLCHYTHSIYRFVRKVSNQTLNNNLIFYGKYFYMSPANYKIIRRFSSVQPAARR